MQNTNHTALVIGVTGSIGTEVSATLLSRGWQVRALHRNPTAVESTLPTSINWVKGDAMQLNDVVEAARGATLIVHAANPPKYRNWRGLALPMLDNTIVKPFPWWAIKLASPFVDVCHEMLEMRYLWQVPLQLDNEKLRAAIGAEPHTPIETALAATLGDDSQAQKAEPRAQNAEPRAQNAEPRAQNAEPRAQNAEPRVLA